VKRKIGTPRAGYPLLAAIVPALALLAFSAYSYSPPVRNYPALARRSCLADPSPRTLAFDTSPAGEVVYEFVFDGVFQQNPAAAYDLATDEAHGGWSRRQWATGNITVVPEPISPACTLGARRYRYGLAWDAVLKINGVYYLVTVVRADWGWLIDYFQPMPRVSAPRGGATSSTVPSRWSPLSSSASKSPAGDSAEVGRSPSS
jgi:hypothetical protein